MFSILLYGPEFLSSYREHQALSLFSSECSPVRSLLLYILELRCIYLMSADVFYQTRICGEWI